MEASRSTASPIMCSFLWFCFCCPSAQDSRRTQEVTRKIGLSWHTTKKKQFCLSASHQHHSQSDLIRGEQQGQHNSLAENTWQLLCTSASRCGGISSISLTCLLQQCNIALYQLVLLSLIQLDFFRQLGKNLSSAASCDILTVFTVWSSKWETMCWFPSKRKVAWFWYGQF